MQRMLAVFVLFALVACAPATPAPTDAAPIPRAARGIEHVPAELSIEHFAGMRLEGTDFALGDVLADDPAYTRYAVTYRSNGLLISGIMNIPKGKGPFPLLVLNHGYIDLAIYTTGRGLKREQDFLARRGFAVLHTDYRGHASSDPSPDTRNAYDAGLEYAMDSANAVAAVRAAKVPAVNTARVGMLGHSLGGGVSLNVAVAREGVIDAIVLYAPVHADAWENFMRWRDEREEGDRTRELLGTRGENPGLWDALSSQTYLEDLEVPVLLFHGGSDKDVPKKWSDGLARRLRNLGKEVTYVEYAAEGHEFAGRWGDFMERTARFFTRELAPEPSAPLLDASRVTKKPFGIAITRADSPVQPERFSGFHTGTDFEAPDDAGLPVEAICDGDISRSDWVSGYGGLVVQRCVIGNDDITVLYGHLDPESTLSSGDVVTRGRRIGLLGKGFSRETDGERPHLHLAIHKGTAVDLRGYVQDGEALGAWINPMTVLE